MSTVVVTGACGFIGQATMNALTAAGHHAVPFDQALGADVRKHPIPACDAVIHLAGVLGTSELFDDPHRAVDVNVHGTLAVLQDCERMGAAYVGIGMPRVWSNVYSATKGAALDLAEAWRLHRGLRVAHVRAFNVYGPGQAVGPGHPQKIVPTFADRSWRGLPMPIWGDGSQPVDLVHVDDVAGLLVDMAEGLLIGVTPGLTLDAATGVTHTVREVAEMVGNCTGNTAVEHLPMRPGEHPVTWEAHPGCEWSLGRFMDTVDSYRPQVGEEEVEAA